MRERGAIAVEAALVFPLLFLMIFGIFDMGMFMKSDMDMQTAARNGVRLASALPQSPEMVPDAVSETLDSLPKHRYDVTEVWVYEANSDGYPGLGTSFPATCPEKCVRYRFTGAEYVVEGQWDTSTVRACVGNADTVGVRLVAHTGRTLSGLMFPDEISTHTVMKFEPVDYVCTE